MISRTQLLNRLRQEGFTHGRDAKRVSIWRQPATGRRVTVPRNKTLTRIAVESVLRQAGLDEAGVDEFLRNATGDC